MKVLCVAEKPSISKSITQILSGGQFATRNTQSNFIKNYEFDYPQTQSSFIVTAVAGHLTSHDFFDTHRKWYSCEPFDLFDAPVETQIAADKKAIEQNILAQARGADILIIWTDCDREGEHIGLEIARVCRRANAQIRIKRARFSAIIAQQIHNAAQHPVELDRRQADAVEARIMLDLKVGAAFTRMQTLILQGRVPQIADEKNVVSYGPCQFPTLGFVVQRYQHVKNFRPEFFWYIYLSLTRQNSSQANEETRFTWQRGHLFDEVAVNNLFLMMTNTRAVVTNVTNQATKKWRPLPLTTVELQKAGSRLLHLAPKKVLDVAEKLYQQGFVSYPRTETDEFDPEFDNMFLIAKQTDDPSWGAFADSLQQGGYSPPRKGKNNDKAHPPIHPTAHANNLQGDEKRVYEYITRRYLACCSKDAEGWLTTVNVECAREKFTATGLVVKERNYLNVYIYDNWTGHKVPDFQVGEEFQPTVCEVRQGQTSKPCYLTEADLVTLMDKNGIGTDATIAQHIQTIVDRDYVIERMEGATKYLIPSTLGIGLIEGYNQIGLAKNVSKPQLRRETERRMVQVCQGITSKNDMLEYSLHQYKEMFIIVKREFEKVTSSVIRYLSGEGDAQNAPGGNDHGPGGGGGGGDGGGRGGGDGGGRGGGNGGGRGRGRGVSRGRGTPAARGSSATRGGRGRGGGGLDYSSTKINDVTRKPSPSTAISRPPVSSVSTSVASSVPSSSSTTTRPTAPLNISSSWTVEVAKSSMSGTTSSMTLASNVVHCECGTAAVQRTVERDTASKGKNFWTCFKSSCGFFQWVEDPSSSSGLKTTQESEIPAKRAYPSREPGPSTSRGEDRMCSCNEEAVLHTVYKESENKGRKFWKCRKGDHAKCGFFEWDDEPPRKAASFGQGVKSRTQSMDTSSGATNSTDGCYKCGKPGHWASACPDADSANKRSRSFGSNAYDRTNSTFTCYKCQQPGHLATACPDNAPYTKGKSAAADSSSNGCHKCGKSGHWSSKCPDTSGSGTRRSSSGKRGRSSGGSVKSKRGRGGKKKSAFSAADEY